MGYFRRNAKRLKVMKGGYGHTTGGEFLGETRVWLGKDPGFSVGLYKW